MDYQQEEGNDELSLRCDESKVRRINHSLLSKTSFPPPFPTTNLESFCEGRVVNLELVVLQNGIRLEAGNDWKGN